MAPSWPSQGPLYAIIVALYLCEAVGSIILFRAPHKGPPLDEADAKRLHNGTYKRWGAALMVCGLGGFVPSLLMLCVHGRVWSVQHNGPHDNVCHIPYK